MTEKIMSAEDCNAVSAQYRMKYHMIPAKGWMNDPNGLIYYKGKYHLFYQSNPVATTTGTMCWGHFVSDDLISYRDVGTAIAPDGEDESIFSGGALEADGYLVALYTLHREKGDFKSEEVYAARSSDGMKFEKLGKVFDNAKLPPNISRSDFRDPCPAKIGDEYFVFVGGKDIEKNAGLIVVLGGKDIYDLDYRFTIGPFYELGDMGECPSYCRADGKDVIIVSGCNVPQRGNDFRNINSSVFIVGEIDFGRGTMRVDSIREIDKGDSFYAPQFIAGAKKPVMVGWQEMWGKRYLTHELHHGWVGAFTIPREISVRGNEVFQTPVSTLSEYCVPAAAATPCMRLEAELGAGDEVIIRGGNGSVKIGNDGGIFLDTTLADNLNGCVRRTDCGYERCTVLVLTDVSGIELFIDGGRETISGRIYLDGAYSMECRGKARILSIKEIKVE